MLPVFVVDAKIVHFATVDFEGFSFNCKLWPLGLQTQLVAVFFFVLVMIKMFWFWVVRMRFSRMFPYVVFFADLV